MDIIVGRSIDDLEKYKYSGSIFIGKQYIKMENATSLSNNIYLDVNNPHLILIAGKRGQGKSYTLASIFESLATMEEDLLNNFSGLIFDTMGIFWTMKFPNYRDAEALERWGLKPQAIKNSRILVPEGLSDKYRDIDMPIDDRFSLNPSDLSGIEWVLSFNLDPSSQLSLYIQRIIKKMQENNNRYTIEDIINYIEKLNIDNRIKNSIITYFDSANSWGLFSDKGYTTKDLLKPGYINILDISLFTAITGGWSIKNLVIGLIAKKIFYERLLYRKKEELDEIYISRDMNNREFPLVWLAIDEAHESIPNDSITPATESLIQIIREGRQPGITLVLATQQPGKMHTDVITQSDIVISHRVTAERDLNSLNEIMKNFSAQDIDIYMNENLPKKKGAALILDDKSEKIYAMQIKPRISWHGGADPTLIRKRLWLNQ
ncbi:DNA double-strand break repair helicase HerA [Nanobdella aerobiophila]|uniref:DNA double-strand break repair helicase HerA n=1 Tax=Nanobdella aerobiophila TaxID=2586965 RepID=A0A915SL73_9ARCH|nr:ATP-binding protein [Nanobdella aerobiophila]BBL45781.1 DNA double-strand break repair helicase HerA [Nanobdella aerobiophila]